MSLNKKLVTEQLIGQGCLIIFIKQLEKLLPIPIDAISIKVKHETLVLMILSTEMKLHQEPDGNSVQ